jgi:aspartyl-tRNA(Asn)/glutamyl-tRNA(Gln) amidotransferase subunit A
MRGAVEIATAIQRRDLRAAEVLEEAHRAVDARNNALNAFVYLDWDLAEEVAKKIDARIERGLPVGPLAGVPFGIKDLDDCAGMPTSQGSLIYKGQGPKTTDAPHVARLRSAGAVPIGKTAPSEFGMDTATTTRAWGVTRNPWNLERTPGGSSGGSAAAVEAGMVPIATASDLGGSTRVPAAFTNLVGLNPSIGRIPQAPSTTNLSRHGVLTRTIVDTARSLDAMAGQVVPNWTWPSPAPSYEVAIEELDVSGLKAAWSLDLGFAVVEDEVASVTQRTAIALCEAARLQLVDTVPRFTSPGPIIFHLEFPRYIHNLRRLGIWPKQRDQLSRAALWGADLAVDMGFEDFLNAELDLVQVRRELEAFFEHHDVLITPAVACRPYGADAPYPTELDGRDVRHTTIEPFTQLSTLGLLPSISVPAGLSSDGLPIGLQIVGGPRRDDIVLRLARILEQAQPWPLPPHAIA